MQPHQFKPTSDEIEFAECIQRTTARKSTGAFNTDAARRVLKESGLSHSDIREICTIADRDGNGKLSNEELCAVIRLAGWVQQCGEKVSEHLLAAAGPLPVLKGISCGPRSPEVCAPEHNGPYRSLKPHNVSIAAPKLSEPQQAGVYHFDQLRAEWHQPKPQPVYPAIDVAHMQICRSLFERAGPINGLMDKETAQEVLMTRFNAPFCLLKTIFNLVRTSNRLSLNIFEFTLAAYFVEGLQSGMMKTLPSAVPRGLYDQLWTPTLLNASPMNSAIGTQEHKLDSMVSAERSPVASAQSFTSDLGLTAALRLSPVRKEPQPFSGHCPSVSSIERKKISKLWKRVAEHCKIERILKVSSTKNRKNKRESVLSSDPSIQGTAYTDASSGSSFEALERDSFLEPTMGQRVSMDITRLPLIYPSETGFFTVPGPAPTEVQHFVGAEMHRLDNIMGYSSVDYEKLNGDNSGETMPVISAFSLEESVGYEAGIGEVDAEAETAANSDSDVVVMLKDMKEEYTLMKLQMQIMQKTIQKLGPNGRPIAKKVHFASGIGADLGERAHDSIQMASGTSRRTQSLKTSKELVGPRDMLSIRSESSASSSRSAMGRAYARDHRRRHQQQGMSERVQGPRTRHRDSQLSSICSLSSLESLSEIEGTSIHEAPDYRRLPEVPDDNTITTLPLRSILKSPADGRRPRRIRVVDHGGHPSDPKHSPTTIRKHRKRVTKRSGMTEGTLQIWNARFIPVDRILKSREGNLVTKQSRKLPRTPRQLPTPKVLPLFSKLSQSRHLPPLPTASSSKFPGALTDDGCSTSSHFDVDIDTASYLDTVPSSAASTPRSSAELSSVFSHHRHSARTTLLTEIDEYNDTVVRDLKEVAPELVLHVEKCLLRELHTKSDGMYDGVRNGLEALAQSSMAKELEEALAQLCAREEELKCLEDAHAEVLRQGAREVAELEQENDELQWTIADQNKQICNLIAVELADHSVQLPEYTPSESSTSEWRSQGDSSTSSYSIGLSTKFLRQ